MRDLGRIRRLYFREGLSLSAIARKTGYSRNTVKRWLIEHLLGAEQTDRALRSIRYQLHAAKFPVHRDLAGFDFQAFPVNQDLIRQLADLSFTETAQNVVFIGGTGTGKSYLLRH